jgi:hypothetical protein
MNDDEKRADLIAEGVIYIVKEGIDGDTICDHTLKQCHDCYFKTECWNFFEALGILIKKVTVVYGEDCDEEIPEIPERSGRKLSIH